jgi:hypothetical protein
MEELPERIEAGLAEMLTIEFDFEILEMLPLHPVINVATNKPDTNVAEKSVREMKKTMHLFITMHFLACR